MMFSKATTDYLELLSTSGTSSNLHRFKILLALLDNPQDKIKCVHLAGTNGKGSVASYLSHILQEANYKVGLYTSPDLVSVTERISINGKLISENDFERLLMQVQHATNTLQPFALFTYFEVLTALSFLYYANNQCDIVILETGLGGRHDATNVIHSPLCSILTTISYDHIERLGSTLREIAYEKVGIIKPCCPTISYPQETEVMELIISTCKMQNSPLSFCHFELLSILSSTLEGQVFNYKHYSNLYIKLLGKHQCYNAVLALEVIDVLINLGIAISKEAIYKGFKNTRWPGRLEIIQKHPLFLIDGAHNVQGAKALKEAIIDYFKYKKVIYLFGSLKDKDRKQILELTMPLAQSVILVTPPSSRAVSTHLLAQEVASYCPHIFKAATLNEATTLALLLADADSVIIAFGSLYFIGEIPKIISNGR